LFNNPAAARKGRRAGSRRAIKMVRTLLTAACLLAATAFAAAQDSAQVAKGSALYAEHCATCHGADGRRGTGFQTPIWGAQTQIGKFGNAQGIFEYVQMLMPFQDPTLLTDEQKLAVVAYLLANHGAILRSGEMTGANMAGIPIR
jgi:mono/diheme cytochrome c family protein